MTKPDIKPFNYGPLSFRLLKEDDLSLTLEWRNQDRVRTRFFNSNKIEYKDHLSWFKKYSEKNNDFTFIIIERRSGRLIGQVALYGIVDETKSAEKGRSIIGNVEDLGKGYGQIATLAMIDFAFRQRGLRHLVANAKVDNYASIKMNKRSGFKEVHVDNGVCHMEMIDNRRAWEKWDNDGVSQAVLNIWRQHGYNNYIDSIAEIVMQNIGTSIIDVGCGSGHLFDVVDSERMIGLDNSIKLLSEAIGRNAYDNVRYQYGSVLDIPYENDSFDTVTCFGVLPYIGPFFNGQIDEYQQSISELFRVAKNTVIISIFDSPSIGIHEEQISGVNFAARTISPLIFREQVNRAVGNKLVHFDKVGRWSIYTFVKQQRPKHSVIVGSYNRPIMIKDALRSIKEQTVQDFEVIISDDGSNGSTIQSIKEEIGDDSRFTLLRHAGPPDGQPRPHCAVRAVNRINDAIPYVRGEFVHYLPDDDLYHKERFASFEKLFSDKKVMIGYGRSVHVNKNGKSIGVEQYPGGPIYNPLSVLGQTQMSHRTELFNVIPRWPTQNIDYASDGFFFKSLVDTGFGPIVGIDRVVSYHRFHPYNMLRTFDKTTSTREEGAIVMSAALSKENEERTTNKIKRAICILGMHRSGTSALTRLVNLLGVYLGSTDQFNARNHRNPLGFWEKPDLVSLNDHILKSIQRQWNDDVPIKLERELPEGKLNKLERLVSNEFGGHDLWAWKDPRNCLLLRFWRQALSKLNIDIEYLFIFRNPLSCAESMNGLHDVDCDVFRGLRMWVNYTLSAVANLGHGPKNIISYRYALNNPIEAADELADLFELDRPDKDQINQIRNWMKPSMSHYEHTLPDLEEITQNKHVCPGIFGEILLDTYSLMRRGQANNSFLNSPKFIEEGRRLFTKYSNWVRCFHGYKS